jgi:aminopeptidase N
MYTTGKTIPKGKMKMKHIYQQIKNLLFILFLFPGIAAGQPTDSVTKLPPVNWTRSRKVDVKHIVIDLNFDWAKKQAYGATTISFTPFNQTNQVFFDAGMLTINSITLANSTPLQFNYDGGDKNDGLAIMLDRMYQPEEEITVKIDYHTNWINTTDPNFPGGSDGKGIRFFEPSSYEPKRRKQIWSMGEPEFNRYWFPSYDAPNDLRTTEFIATVDKSLFVISNGDLIEIKENANGTKTFHYKMNKPYPNAKTSFVVGEYIDIRQTYEDITLHSFGYPDEADAVAASVVRLPDMVKFFSAYTGVRYPHSTYSQVFVQEAPWGIAYSSVSTHTENMVDDYGTHADFFYLWDGLEAEGLAHQWFGNYIFINDWSDSWLSRGFAHYFDRLYNEYKNGKEEALLYQLQGFGDIAIYISDWNSGARRPVITRNYEAAANITNDNYPYFRGAAVLHMLRKQLGEANWHKAIKHYVKAYAGKPVTTADFLKSIEESTGEAMDWFFDQWLYKMGHPVFEVTKKYDADKKQLLLIVKQVQKMDSSSRYPQVDFFKGGLEIEIDGKIEQVWLEPKAENIFSFSASQEPKLVNFDYEGTWIKELKFEKSLNELLYQLENDKDIVAKRQAISELVVICRNEKTATGDRQKIHAAFRNVISGNAYWRLRFIALGQLQALIAPVSNPNPAQPDEATIAMLLKVIKHDSSWVRTAAINFLGMTRDKKYAGLYITCLNDPSDRVINAAANALGRSKSPKAFTALVKLINKPSWKNQSIISAMNGLKELGDKRAAGVILTALADSKSPHWTLATSVWDHRLAAADALVALGIADKGYPIVFLQFKKAMEENNINDIFYNVQQVAVLGDPRGKEVFEMLKTRFKDDANAMAAIDQYETKFREAIKDR